MKGYWKRNGRLLEVKWKAIGSKVEGYWKQSERPLEAVLAQEVRIAFTVNNVMHKI